MLASSPPRLCTDHGNSHGIGFLQAQPQVLVEQREGEAEIERAWDDAARDLVLRSAVAGRSRH